MTVARLTFADPGREGAVLKMGKDIEFVTLTIGATDRDVGDRAGKWVRVDVDADKRVYFGTDDVVLTDANSIVVYAGQPETFEIATQDQRIKIGNL